MFESIRHTAICRRRLLVGGRRKIVWSTGVVLPFLVGLLVAASPPPARSQEMSFEEYDPVSTLAVPQHPTERARLPFIDVHNHQFRAAQQGPEVVDQIVADMDKLNMAVMVNLSGGSGDRLKTNLAAMNERYPGRFVQFANISYDGIDEPGWSQRTALQLEADIKAGAQGLKIYKDLGMFVTGKNGRVHTDDPRLDAIWEKCGELGVPVLIHTGEPSPFWLPPDLHNERWLELKQYPNRRRDDPEKFASFEDTMAEQWNMFRKHPRTKFISAHLSWLGNDLGRLGKLLDEIPNMYTELGAVIAELGRQPRFAREFLTKYQDRVLIGKDVWEPSEYYVYFRVLESADEYFDYYRKRHAFWKMYGLDLPDDVLKKVYYKNALKLIPGIDSSRFPN